MPEPKLLTVPELAKFLRVHESTVHRLRKDPGFIPEVRVGARVLFRSADAENWITGHAEIKDHSHE